MNVAVTRSYDVDVFNLDGGKIVFLLIVALVVLAPDKLPDAMRKAGKAYADLRRIVAGFQDEVKSVLDEPMRELRATAQFAKDSAAFGTAVGDKPGEGPLR